MHALSVFFINVFPRMHAVMRLNIDTACASLAELERVPKSFVLHVYTLSLQLRKTDIRKHAYSHKMAARTSFLLCLSVLKGTHGLM